MFRGDEFPLYVKVNSTIRTHCDDLFEYITFKKVGYRGMKGFLQKLYD